jgi:hypothetical protein
VLNVTFKYIYACYQELCKRTLLLKRYLKKIAMIKKRHKSDIILLDKKLLYSYYAIILQQRKKEEYLDISIFEFQRVLSFFQAKTAGFKFFAI